MITHGLFFPGAVPHRGSIPHGKRDPVRRQIKVAKFLDERSATLELVAESVKLAAVRDHEAGFARVGYVALIVAVLPVVAYLGMVAATALSTGG